MNLHITGTTVTHDGCGKRLKSVIISAQAIMTLTIIIDMASVRGKSLVCIESLWDSGNRKDDMNNDNIIKLENRRNRRTRRAIVLRDCVRATYYDADHTARFGMRAWELVNRERRPLNIGRI